MKSHDHKKSNHRSEYFIFTTLWKFHFQSKVFKYSNLDFWHPLPDRHFAPSFPHLNGENIIQLVRQTPNQTAFPYSNSVSEMNRKKRNSIKCWFLWPKYSTIICIKMYQPIVLVARSEQRKITIYCRRRKICSIEEVAIMITWIGVQWRNLNGNLFMCHIVNKIKSFSSVYWR